MSNAVSNDRPVSPTPGEDNGCKAAWRRRLITSLLSTPVQVHVLTCIANHDSVKVSRSVLSLCPFCSVCRGEKNRPVECSAVPTYNTFHFTVPDSTDYTAPLSLHSPLPLRVVDTLPPPLPITLAAAAVPAVAGTPRLTSPRRLYPPRATCEKQSTKAAAGVFEPQDVEAVKGRSRRHRRRPHSFLHHE